MNANLWKWAVSPMKQHLASKLQHIFFFLLWPLLFLSCVKTKTLISNMVYQNPIHALFLNLAKFFLWPEPNQTVTENWNYAFKYLKTINSICTYTSSSWPLEGCVQDPIFEKQVTEHVYTISPKGLHLQKVFWKNLSCNAPCSTLLA